MVEVVVVGFGFGKMLVAGFQQDAGVPPLSRMEGQEPMFLKKALVEDPRGPRPPRRAAAPQEAREVRDHLLPVPAERGAGGTNGVWSYF